MAIDEIARIVSHEEAGPGYRFLVVEAPKLAAALVPGVLMRMAEMDPPNIEPQ